MRYCYHRLLYLFLLLGGPCALAQRADRPVFTVVPLGVRGGLAEGNLSAYLVAPAGTNSFVCLDAGTLRQGVEKAIANGVFAVPADTVLRRYVKAYFISHAHLDHMAGLILNSPEDAPKAIYGLPSCLSILQTSYFNWHAWPNFGSGGNPPALGKYRLRELLPNQNTAIDHTALKVRAFALSHGKAYESTAFLLEHNRHYLLYLGDTGADAIEQQQHLRELWQAVAPLVKAGQLKALFIEVSFPNAQPVAQLFGHLTPALLLKELNVLGQLAGPAALRGLPVVITHLKPTEGSEAVVRQQLQEANHLHLKFVFPEQGKKLDF
jgi:cAMP phosphodiesterase